jgi:zinc transport system substrate-binding protein
MLRQITLLLSVFCALLVPQVFAQTQLNGGESGGVKVVTTIKPLQLIVSAVTDGISTPVLLIPANQSYHHYTLRPSAVRILDDADLVIWVGPELETYLTGVFTQIEAKTQVIRAFELPGLQRHEFNKEAVTAADEPQDNNHSGQYDTHIWLDTNNARLIAESAAQRLSVLDPANASRYASNLAAFSMRLQHTQQRNAEISATLQNLDYAVYHNAFQYFEKQNGLQHQLVFVTAEDMQPGIRHIMAVRNALQQIKPVCLLEDVTTNPATVTTVLGEFNINRERADLLGENLTLGPDAYTQLIRNLADVFQRCLTPR